MNPDNLDNISRRQHPLQRFSVLLAGAAPRSLHPLYNVYEFIGQLENMDVFWLPGRQIVMMKFSSKPGDAYTLTPDGTLMQSYAARAPMPSKEEQELVLAMCRCFAQEGRPPEWDEAVPENT